MTVKRLNEGKHDNPKKQRVMEKHVCTDMHLTVDQLNAHDIVTKIPCPFGDGKCKDTFSNKSALNTHIGKVHGCSADQFNKKYESVCLLSKSTFANS